MMGEALTEKEWETFFDLLTKIVSQADLTYVEKTAQLERRAKADSDDTESALKEFLSWFETGEI